MSLPRSGPIPIFSAKGGAVSRPDPCCGGPSRPRQTPGPPRASAEPIQQHWPQTLSPPPVGIEPVRGSPHSRSVTRSRWQSSHRCRACRVRLVHRVVGVLGNRVRIVLHRPPEVGDKPVRRRSPSRCGNGRSEGTAPRPDEERLDVVVNVARAAHIIGPGGFAAEPREGGAVISAAAMGGVRERNRLESPPVSYFSVGRLGRRACGSVLHGGSFR